MEPRVPDPLRSRAAFAAWVRTASDTEVDRWLGIDEPPAGSDLAAGELVGYLPSGVEAILQALHQSELREDQTLVDIGAGAGKVVMLARLLTGADAIGIEHQPELVAFAQARSRRLQLDRVEFLLGDAREGFPTANVYFLYLPFTGATLDRVMSLLAEKPRPFVVCALGLELQRYAFLRPRPTEHFWLTLYDALPAR